MVNEGLIFLKARPTLVKSSLYPVLVCEKDKVATQKVTSLVLHSKVAMKRLGRGKTSLQHNIPDLFPGILTDPDR